MRKLSELLLGNKALRISGYITLLGMLGLTAFSNYDEVMQAIHNRPAVSAHRDAIGNAQEGFDNALLDYIGHMTREEFNEFANALAMTQGATVDVFMNFRDEQWMNDIINSDQVGLREELGMIDDRAQDFITGDRTADWSSDRRRSARTQMISVLEDIVDTATIADPNMSLEEFVGMRLAELHTVQASSPDVERHASGIFITVNAVLTLLAALGIYTLADISAESAKLKKQEKADEAAALERLFDKQLKTFGGMSQEEILNLAKKYEDDNARKKERSCPHTHREEDPRYRDYTD